MAELVIDTPRVFLPLLEPARYKAAWGGRGSGKSHFFAECAIEKAILTPGTRGVCIRENQRSLRESSKRLIEDKIQALKVGSLFDVQDKLIKAPGDGLIHFQGMQDHTAESIKSLEGYDWAWVEEAQALSARSLKMLRPTIRKPGSELWFSWNPDEPEDPVDALLRGPKRITSTPNRRVAVVHANWRDNPWFPADLEEERLSDLARDQDEYDHVWEGGYVKVSDAVIFRQRVEVRAFETPVNARFYHGVDWGYSQDPTVIVRCFIQDDCLFVDYEAGGTGIELDGIAAVFDQIGMQTGLLTARRWPIKADCAQPAIISHVQRHGFPITGAEKWSGSVEDGIKVMQAFKKIVVHERCPQTAKEFRLYSWKVDKRTDPPEILPVIVDKWNHYIDAIRYGIQAHILSQKAARTVRLNLMGR
jgi:phage terminase large subunit